MRAKPRTVLAGVVLAALVFAISVAAPRHTEGTVAAAVQVVNPYVPAEVENSSRTPFEYNALVSPDINGGFSVSDPVPTGKRLVVDFVSGACNASVGIAGLVVVRSGPFDDSDHVFVLTFIGNNFYGISQQTHFYVEAGQPVTVFNEASGNSCDIHVTGFLVNHP